MGPDWWTDAWLACEDLYGAQWDRLTEEQQAEAVNDFIRQCADIARKVKEENSV